MSDMWFTWKGEHSDAYGIIVKSLPPVYAPALRDDSYIVPGRHGALHRSAGDYDEQLMMLEGYIPYEQAGSNPASLESIKAWLRGSGILTLSDRPGRAYRGRITDEIAFIQWVAAFDDRLFSVSFWCEPFAYDDDPVDIEITTSGTDIVNPGTFPASPIIKVEGSGDVVLAIGGTAVGLTGLTGTVTIDCEARFAYATDATDQVAITLADHVWPELAVGTSAVSWVGSVTKVTITPNWRWL
jgi:phage-related protein